MRILMSGSTGLIGSELVPFLKAEGHRVVRLVRSRQAAGDDAVYWNPDLMEIDHTGLEGADAVIHLAGENIGGARWTDMQKARILLSRQQGTRLLATALAGLQRKPAVLISASAIGIYGDRGDEELTEASPPGPDTFLVRVVKAWEAAAQPAREAGIRVVHPRFGLVLSPKGGALKEFMVPFRLFAGGPLAHGRHYQSWIAMDDVLGVFRHLLNTESLSGPVNGVAPSPVRQRDFARTLGRVMGRPSWFNVPRAAVALRVGSELAEALLWSQCVIPAKLQESGYPYRFPDLEATLRHLIRE